MTQAGPGRRSVFVGRLFPTFFRISKEPDRGLIKPCAINKTCRVEFETDAANDYFIRASNPGSLRITPADICEHSHLWNGQWVTRFRVPWDAKVGDEVPVEVTVSDVEREAHGAPFVCRFILRAAPPADDRPTGKPGPGTPQHPAQGKHDKLVAGFPPVNEVDRSGWAPHGFTKLSALKVVHGLEGGYEFFVNIDNAFLLTQLSQSKAADRSSVKFWFKYGLVLAALAMIKQQSVEEDHADEHGDGEEVDLDAIGASCDGLARAIVPIIRALGKTPQLVSEEVA